MKHAAPQIEASAIVEGETKTRYILCDIDESTGVPIAVLFWPASSDKRGHIHPLVTSELSTSQSSGGVRSYEGSPIPIPKVLAEMRPAPLSDDGFRLGFFFLPDSHGDTQ